MAPVERVDWAMPTSRSDSVLRSVTEQQGQEYLSALVRVFHDDYKPTTGT